MGRDRYDYMGRCREQRATEGLLARRRMAIKVAPRICEKIADGDNAVSELFFDGTPTLGQLVAEVGGSATILSIEKQDRAVR
ncbi:MAG: hypothetical protein WA822_11795, partial [Albidovulum sp.]